LKQLEVSKKNSKKFKMSKQNIEHWRSMPLISIEEVLARTPEGEELGKSAFSDLDIDLSGSVPNSFARTLSGKRVDLSVLDCDSEILDDFARDLDWIRSTQRSSTGYQIGYSRDFSHGKPQLKYIRIEYGQKVEEKVF